MRTLFALLIVAAVSSPLMAQQYGRGFGRTGSHSAMVRQYRPMPHYRPHRQLYQPMLFGYGYGPGFYSSANQPIVYNVFPYDPYYGW